MIVRVPSNEFRTKVEEGKYINPREAPDAEEPVEKKSYCTHVCEALPLVCKSFKMKMSDHLLLGGEHIKKISPGFHSPIKPDEETTPEEKKEIVKASPSFGMFSLFKYHLKYGYLNKELKKQNKIYCSHIFSLVLALPIFSFYGTMVIICGISIS